MIRDLDRHARVEGGFASVASVVRPKAAPMPLEDHMPSYFLAEACKYLWLIFNDSFWQVQLSRPALHGSPGLWPNTHDLIPMCAVACSLGYCSMMHQRHRSAMSTDAHI